MDIKKIAIGGLIAGGVWYGYRLLSNVSNALVVGSPKFAGFSAGKLLLSMPVSNISRIAVSFDGFSGYLDVKGGRVGEVTIINQRKRIAPNTTETFSIEVTPNWAAVAFLGVDIIKLIKNGKLKDVKATVKGKGFSGAISFDVNVPIV